MLDGNILVVGGYGAVGQVIALTLADTFPGQIIVAGHNYAKAQALTQESNGRIHSLLLDMASAHESPDILDGVAIVVMCLDAPDTRFIQQVLQRGIHYVDITAEDALFQQIESMDDVAKASGSTTILSVGLTPGLTNLLTRHLQSQFDRLDQVDIHVFLGLGEAHGAGEAAARWLLHNLNASYTVRRDGKPLQVGSFSEKKVVTCPNGLGRRPVYRFNIADQHVLTRTLDLPSVSTWVTFDPPTTNIMMSFMRWSGLSKFLRYQRVEDVVVGLSTLFKKGSDAFVVQVQASGEVGGQRQTKTVAISGREQGRATAYVTAQVVEQLIASNFPSGVFHSEQLFEPISFFQQLSKEDFVFHGM